MAFIYRYQIKNGELRNNTSLLEYNQEINEVVEILFSENLKECIVEERYFEFRLYVTVHKRLLQEMGRLLKSRLPIGIHRYGFVRMEQTFYALFYSTVSSREDFIYGELIDSTLLDEKNSFLKRANNFYEKKVSNNLLYENPYSENINEIKKNLYIDIMDTYIDHNSLFNISTDTNEISCYFVKGRHRRIEKVKTSHIDRFRNNLLQLEGCFDIGIVENEALKLSNDSTRGDYLDFLEIHDFFEMPEVVETIMNELSLHINETEKIEALDVINKKIEGEIKRCVFKTHNVGQALATSLSDENNSILLYFDYGMPYGGNAFTRPARINMPTNPGITIILSHVDKDHWFRLADDINAYRCHWYIPDQPRGPQFNHKLAEIIVSGGSVHMINSDLSFPCGTITYSGYSKINPLRTANHVHEMGLTLRIQGSDVKGDELNIL
ncbi:hypothetical protein F3D3_2394 [Fusibacter sp. 3D3]|nr:hypothetical protein F3D3_2394 [Fusibacter sp. 3D3]